MFLFRFSCSQSFTLVRQVSKTTAAAARKEVTFGDALAAVQAHSKCFQQAQAAAKASETDKDERFEATKLGSPELLGWLAKLGAKLASKLRGLGKQFITEGQEAVVSSHKLLKSLPAFSVAREAEYRETLSAKHKSFGAQGTQLRHVAADARQARKAVEAISSAVFLRPEPTRSSRRPCSTLGRP